MKSARLLLAALTLVLSGTAFGGCGACPGCAPIWPVIKKASESINKAFDEAEAKNGEYYRNNILPLEIVADLAERQAARAMAKIEVIDRSNLLLREEIIFELKRLKRLLELIGDIPK